MAFKNGYFIICIQDYNTEECTYFFTKFINRIEDESKRIQLNLNETLNELHTEEKDILIWKKYPELVESKNKQDTEESIFDLFLI